MVYDALLIENYDLQKQYLTWLFSNEQEIWFLYPKRYELFIESLSNLIQVTTNNVIEDDHHVILIQLLLLNIPEDILIDTTKKLPLNWQEILEVNHSVIVLESGFLEVPVENWYRWVENAIKRKDKTEGFEVYNNIEVKTRWEHTNDIATQRIELQWMNDNQESISLVIFIPVAQLYVETDKEMYIKEWLHLVEIYHSFSMQDVNTIPIDELVTKLSAIPDYFYRSASFYMINNQSPLFNTKLIYPEDPEFFINLLPGLDQLLQINLEDWISSFIKDNCNDSEEMLSLFSSIPIGDGLTFVNITKQLVILKEIKEDDILDWIIKEIKFSHNPVQKQRLLYYVLSSPDHIKKESIFEMIKKELANLLHYEKEKVDKNYRLYISLIQYAYSSMSINFRYDKYTEIQKIFWAYRYADQMLKEIIELNGPISVEEVIVILEGACTQNLSKELLKSRYPNSFEVCHPLNTNVWRTVIGGTLDILLKSKPLNSLKTILNPICNHLYQTATNNHLDIDRKEENTFSFFKKKNDLKTSFGENNIIRIIKLLNRFKESHEWIPDYVPEEQAFSVINQVIENNEKLADYSGYLINISSDLFSDHLTVYVKTLINNYELSCDGDFNDSLLQEIVVLSSLIVGLPVEERNQFSMILLEKLIDSLDKPIQESKVIFNLIYKLSVADTTKHGWSLYVELMESFLNTNTIFYEDSYTASIINGALEKAPLILRNRVQELRRNLKIL
ncbi:hypothetical protein PTI45_02368 [Paenibacillus nuruki]|uniref:Uncharacterized protein n=2 Tax=Paenibacillus nuruki TaxID=1886670 RepID=A0A1E3L3P5_9BACL|nr:hypothetical protein PTI45_02368 [Paenibacillus nuruki]